MNKFIAIFVCALVFSVSSYAHTAFRLVSIEKKSLSDTDIAKIRSEQTIGRIEGLNISYPNPEVRLIVFTGPSDDVLSYSIQGVRNPNIVVPSRAIVKLLFINVDGDMRHDIRFGHVMGEFGDAPDIAQATGSSMLAARADGAQFNAEEVVIEAIENGAYRYFCSVRGHAKGGMWGNIFVGVKADPNAKMAVKAEHVHSADEGHDAHEHAAPTPVASPTPSADMHDQEKHTDHKRPQSAPSPSTIPAPKHEHGEGAGTGHSERATTMRSSINIADPMSREGSGTSWVPDSSPLYAYMKMFEDGSMLMLHGTMFVRYTSIGSNRDVSAAGKGSRNRFDAPSMFMAMYSKPVSPRSQIGLRAMLSLDPLIERGYGYPLLYQSGELYRGEPIHDRQHPHDLVSELAATYSYMFDEKNSFFVYAGLPGEPALGPPMYLHRSSGMNNPDAPIGHHWQDATHITYGVVTAGFAHDKFKFEASAFNGTEPDENRWAFDPPKLNSFSGRLSFNPTREWAFQVSHGYLKYPERSEPDLKVIRRTTASAIFNKALGVDRNWSSALVWGRNGSDEGNSHSFLFESNYEFDKNAVFGRLENVQKNAHELVLAAPHPEGNIWVGAYSIGYLREIVKGKGVDVGIGGMVTFNTNPSSISNFYGGTNHGGWQLFLRLRPSRMN
jgi:hypothetical protein